MSCGASSAAARLCILRGYAHERDGSMRADSLEGAMPYLAREKSAIIGSVASCVAARADCKWFPSVFPAYMHSFRPAVSHAFLLSLTHAFIPALRSTKKTNSLTGDFQLFASIVTHNISLHGNGIANDLRDEDKVRRRRWNQRQIMHAARPQAIQF